MRVQILIITILAVNLQASHASSKEKDPGNMFGSPQSNDDDIELARTLGLFLSNAENPDQACMDIEWILSRGTFKDYKFDCNLSVGRIRWAKFKQYAKLTHTLGDLEEAIHLLSKHYKPNEFMSTLDDQERDSLVIKYKRADAQQSTPTQQVSKEVPSGFKPSETDETGGIDILEGPKQIVEVIKSLAQILSSKIEHGANIIEPLILTNDDIVQGIKHLAEAIKDVTLRLHSTIQLSSPLDGHATEGLKHLSQAMRLLKESINTMCSTIEQSIGIYNTPSPAKDEVHDGLQHLAQALKEVTPMLISIADAQTGGVKPEQKKPDTSTPTQSREGDVSTWTIMGQALLIFTVLTTIMVSTNGEQTYRNAKVFFVKESNHGKTYKSNQSLTDLIKSTRNKPFLMIIGMILLPCATNPSLILPSINAITIGVASAAAIYTAHICPSICITAEQNAYYRFAHPDGFYIMGIRRPNTIMESFQGWIRLLLNIVVFFSLTPWAGRLPAILITLGLQLASTYMSMDINHTSLIATAISLASWGYYEHLALVTCLCIYHAFGWSKFNLLAHGHITTVGTLATANSRIPAKT